MFIATLKITLHEYHKTSLIQDVVFPCGHATCSECVETIKVCHMCRGPIDKTIHLY